MIRWIWASVLTLVSASAEPILKEGVSVELVSERTRVTPGETIDLAVVFRHQPGYHTYWRQPGLVGLATSLKWTLPRELRAGGILWPAPERTKMAHWGVWGFERDVALVVPVTIPPQLDPNKSPEIKFSVQAAWMACGTTCHPGTAVLTMTLPVTATTGPLTSHASILARTRDEQAVSLPEWKLAATRHRTEDGTDQFALEVTPPPGRNVPADAYFFSYPRLVDSHGPQEHCLEQNGSVRLDLRLTESPDPIPTVLEGELFSKGGWDAQGRKQLLKVKVPLEAQKDARARGKSR